MKKREFTLGAHVNEVIADIVRRYKFSDIPKIVELFEHVIDALRPTYDIEIRTIRELCSIGTGIPSVPEKEVQNRLLRKMISNAPGERVPRHRLIRNLIEMGDYEKADTEIRIFEKDFRADGPVYRYKVNLLVARSQHAPGLMNEDRIRILDDARAIALAGLERFQFNKSLLTAYAELGLAYYKRTANFAYFDEAMKKLRNAEDAMGDPDIGRIINSFTRRVHGLPVEMTDI